MKVKLIKHTPEPERNCAVAARLCYSADGIDDTNSKLDDEKVKELLRRIIKSGHHSVLEHSSFTFGIEGVSRTLLAQLTRHRIASFSVQSQRYVKFKENFEFVIPETIKADKKLLDKYDNFINQCQELYKEFLSANIPAEDARYILPNAAATKIILTMNARELRHFFSLRCCNRAQWEIRQLACEMLDLSKKAAPILFENAGADCLSGYCKEEKPCGKPWKREVES
ncbi:MAG: FAD-dependent thymidylate synthase [Elusimicrobiota bacterium]|jgi:thymidylate synthase (FAD)|nr:FAD-dependent thymidylate synthase [Elusimicrobiota bacterium]